MNPQDPLQQNQQVVQPSGAQQPQATNVPQNPVPSPGIPVTPPEKKTSRLMLVVIGLLILLFLVILLALVLNGTRRQSEVDGEAVFVQRYDSPVGLASGMQNTSVESGTFKLTASYVSGGNFTREGSFAVADGQVRFELVGDDAQVNRLLQQLYARSESKTAFSSEKHGVTKLQTFSFADLLGYHFLYDENGSIGKSGFVPEVEAAKKAAKPDRRFTLTSACDAALAAVKEKTALTTTNLQFEQSSDGIQKRKATIAFSSLEQSDAAVTAFLEACYDASNAANKSVVALVEERKQNVTKSPEFTFWQEGAVSIVEVGAPASDTPFGGSLRFEMSELNSTAKQMTGAVGSYVERRNQFGLAYSLCRTDPVVTTELAAGYRFLREDPSYRYPSSDDSGYYCSTLSVPDQFVALPRMTLKDTTGKNVVVEKSGIDGLRGFHDLAYEVERYNLQNKRYPGPTEFRDIATTNLQELTTVTQQIFNSKKLQYAPTPTGCVGTCSDFVLSYEPLANAQLRRSAYSK